MDTALVEANGLLDIPGCEFTPISLTLPARLSFDHWQRIGRQLQLADIAIQWWLGDWLAYGESKYGEKYSQALEDTGRKKQTLMNYVYVAKSIEFSRRREDVDYSTHVEVAPLEPDEQDRILAKAARENSSRSAVRKEVERIRRAKMPKPDPAERLLSKESQLFLDDYVAELALWTEKIPAGIPVSEREALEKMIFKQGEDALWLKRRTIKTESSAITELFSFDEGTPGMERALKTDISAWLEKCGYYMSDSDLDVRLDAMVLEGVLTEESVEASRQEDRRGPMPSLYALHASYLGKN